MIVESGNSLVNDGFKPRYRSIRYCHLARMGEQVSRIGTEPGQDRTIGMHGGDSSRATFYHYNLFPGHGDRLSGELARIA